MTTTHLPDSYATSTASVQSDTSVNGENDCDRALLMQERFDMADHNDERQLRQVWERYLENKETN